MSATSKITLHADPESGVSAQDAILLAVRNWVWLIAVPVAVTVIVSLVYTSLPTRTLVTAVLNSDMDLVELYAKQIIDGLDETASVTLTRGSGTVIVTSEARDSESALAAAQQIIDATPLTEPPQSSLTATQSLELRALREYLIDMETLLATAADRSAQSDALKAEIAQIQSRIDFLELRDIAPEQLPKVAQEPRAMPIRQPPMRNVAIFTLLFTMFVTWTTIYGRERRRILREKGTL